MSVIDREAILKPISESQPGGSDQTGSSPYLQLFEAMKEDDPNVTLQAWEEAKVADWTKVERLGEDLLTNKTKDLTVAVAYTEALLHKYDIEGLIDGLALIASLCRDYWESLFPELDDPNLLYRRMNAILKFTDKFGEKLRVVHITNPSSSEQNGYTWGHYNEMTHVDKLPPPEQQEALSQGRATSVLFTASERNTPNDFYLRLDTHINELKSAVEDIESILRERCEALVEQLDEKSDAEFSFSKPYEALDLLRQYCSRIIKQRGLDKIKEVAAESPAVSNDDDSGWGSAMPVAMGGGVAASGVLQNRDDAYRELEKIASFLMRIEPHSPVPYLLKRALRWGNMDAREMFLELYNNAGDIQQLYRLLDMIDPYATPETQTYNYEPSQQQPASAPTNDSANYQGGGW